MEGKEILKKFRFVLEWSYVCQGKRIIQVEGVWEKENGGEMWSAGGRFFTTNYETLNEKETEVRNWRGHFQNCLVEGLFWEELSFYDAAPKDEFLNFTLEEVTKAQRESRAIARHFLEPQC